jgi:hypothetical protein
MPTPEELHAMIAQARKDIASVRIDHHGADAKIAVLHSEIFVAASQLAEISSRRLERQTDMLIALTCWLKWLTIVLVILTVPLVAMETFHFFQRRETPVQTDPHAHQTNLTTQKTAHD